MYDPRAAALKIADDHWRRAQVKLRKRRIEWIKRITDLVTSLACDTLLPVQDLENEQNQEGEPLQRHWKISERGHNIIGQNAVRSKHSNTQVRVYSGIAMQGGTTVATAISGAMIS